MKWAIIDPNGQVLNIIAYDGSSPFEPPGGCTLAKVNDWVQIGMAHDAPAPVVVPVDPVPVVPDLATQLAQLLISKNVIAPGDLDSGTLDQVNTTLVSAGMTAIAVPSVVSPSVVTPSIINKIAG